MTDNFPQLRIGNGYDMHRLVPGRPLILGGVKLSHPEGLGLDGHSDADVLTHAIMDAILGALSTTDFKFPRLDLTPAVAFGTINGFKFFASEINF